MHLLAPLLALLLASAAHGATVTSVFDGRVPCLVQLGVQFCAGTLLTRVETWDGVPLDVNVTIPPAAMNGPFPLIVDLHGWAVGKTNQPFVQEAMDGYVVLSYSARGFHQSCGFPPSRLPDPTLTNPNACMERGWIRLADVRYEGRDTQYLAGLLADEGLVLPDRVGVTGSSYGGGQSMMLAALKDRVMLPDGTLVPWQSPGGLNMRIAAAAPLIPWSDLAYALVPNGRTLDYQILNPYGPRIGIPKQSWLDFLHAAGLAAGFYAPTGADPDADVSGWKTRLDAGEPYDGEPGVTAILAEVQSHHSAYYLDDSTAPAPLFIYNAFTDDLFPADEALRFWRKTRAKYPSAEIALQFADAFGHPRASLGGDMTRAQARVRELFARHLQGSGPALPPLETYTQSCGASTETGPFAAADWDALHPGEVRFSDPAAHVFDSTGGDALNATLVDPLGPGTSCRSGPSTDDAAAATYRLPAASGTGYTLMGSPTVIADLSVDGDFAEVAARLWDVAPGGLQYLVSQSLYRPRTDGLGPQVFQLHPNGWHFADGHVAKLELLGQSAPYGRASNGTFTITVTNLELRLPTLEAPDGGAIEVPAPPVLPPVDAEAPACPSTPRAGCKQPVGGGSRLRIVDRSTDRLDWRWKRGAATTTDDFGDPLATTSYTLCVYDGGPAVVMRATAPAGGTCGTTPCWTSTARGFRYDDPAGTPSGVRRLQLDAGPAGKAAIRLKGRVPQLAIAPLPIVSFPVTAQLLAGDGLCWETTFGGAKKNDGARFTATH